MSPCRLKLYASCIDSTIYCFNVGTFSPKPLYEYKGHQASSFYVKHSVSSCGRYLISGSADNKAYIWREFVSKPVAELSGHLGEVTSAVWAPHLPFQVATASEDGSYIIWSVNPPISNAALVCNVSLPPDKTRKPKLAFRNHYKRNINNFDDYNQNGISSTTSPVSPCSKKPRIDVSLSSDFNPTAGLPNYVVDGCSPSIITRSGRKIKNEDWLTQLRRVTPTENREHHSSRRISSNRNSKAKGNLLKYFCNPSRRVKSANGEKSVSDDNGNQNSDNSLTSFDKTSPLCESEIQPL